MRSVGSQAIFSILKSCPPNVCLKKQNKETLKGPFWHVFKNQCASVDFRQSALTFHNTQTFELQYSQLL